MSFNINGPEPVQIVKPAFMPNDGGAGNTGYFRQEKKKKDDEEKDSDTLEISAKNENDVEEKEKNPDLIGTKIKTFWFKIHGIFSEVAFEKKE